MRDLVSLSTEGRVAVVSINNPPVNALSPGVPEAIVSAFRSAEEEISVKAVVLIGEGRTFVAGADIREFSKVTSGLKERGEGFLPLMRFIEGFPKPVICAIHGNALGGGMETAMACHYRVALASARLGQPEIKLGIIPGAGGTQRLPRLIGLADAAQMCATGRPVTASEARRLGLVDRVVEGDLRGEAISFARELIESGAPPRKTSELSEHLSMTDEVRQALAELRHRIELKSRGAVAPLRAIEAVEAAATLPFEEGCRREAQIFKECLFSDQSKALIHFFFAQRAANKIPGIPRGAANLDVRRAAVVGGGTMGSGIAMCFANSGIPVLLREMDETRLQQALSRITRNYEISQQRGKLTPAQVADRMELIRPTTSYEGFESSDIVVEAVFEEMELKKQVFKELAEVCRKDAILASNTSSLDIDVLAAAAGRPERVIGHHFFSPANVMPLLEIVRGQETGKNVVATSLSLARRLEKVGVVVGNCPGFVGNRMFAHYMREAQYLTEEGARVEEVDAALEVFGMAMGPLAVNDLAGLDVGWRVRRAHPQFIAPGMRPMQVADRLCEMGRFGQKTGSGWYLYPEGTRQRLPDPEVEKLIGECAERSGIRRRQITQSEIVERTVFALVNEGARILEEGMALRASDVDVIYVNGYGFPSHRGGPLCYADTIGLAEVCGKIERFQKEHGAWWTVAPLLDRLAAEGKTFADFDRRSED